MEEKANLQSFSEGSILIVAKVEARFEIKFLQFRIPMLYLKQGKAKRSDRVICLNYKVVLLHCHFLFI